MSDSAVVDDRRDSLLVAARTEETLAAVTLKMPENAAVDSPAVVRRDLLAMREDADGRRALAMGWRRSCWLPVRRSTPWLKYTGYCTSTQIVIIRNKMAA